MTRLVALDLSMTNTGLCWGVTTASWPQVTNVTSKAPKPGTVTLATRSKRLRTIAGHVFTRCAGADLIVVEGPSYGSEGKGTWDRAGLWWLVVGRLTGTGLQVVEIPPSNVKCYATGKGNASKDEVLAAVVRRYPHVEVTDNNTADALVMYAMAARFIGQPLEDTLPQTHLRAMRGVAWTPNQ